MEESIDHVGAQESLELVEVVRCVVHHVRNRNGGLLLTDRFIEEETFNTNCNLEKADFYGLGSLPIDYPVRDKWNREVSVHLGQNRVGNKGNTLVKRDNECILN